MRTTTIVCDTCGRFLTDNIQVTITGGSSWVPGELSGVEAHFCRIRCALSWSGWRHAWSDRASADGNIEYRSWFGVEP